MAIEEEFTVELPDDHADNIVTVKQAIDYILAHPHSQ
jgi:acyl carrier protein